jgi:hypothetical protein
MKTASVAQSVTRTTESGSTESGSTESGSTESRSAKCVVLSAAVPEDRSNPRSCHRKSLLLGTSYAWFSAVLILSLLALLTACSSDQKPENAKPEVKAPDLITGRSAFQKTFVAAHGWNADAKPYRLEATATNEGNGHDGKWAIWRGSFASPSARTTKSYTWSGSNADGAPSRGLNPSTEDSYSPTNSSTQVFDINFLKVDTDKAFEEAQKHGGDKVLEKEPDTPVIYICDWNHNTNQLIWHVIYGTSREGAKLTVSIDASTGAFIRVEK